jgi:predicted kinase
VRPCVSGHSAERRPSCQNRSAPDQGSRVHLLCGLLGTGKTTHAKRLAADVGGVRFTLDEWMLRLYGLRHVDPRYPAHLEPCQDLIWDVAVQVLAVGHDVVLDWNQWSRERRARWAGRPRELGYDVLLHYLDVPLETALARVLYRTSVGDPVSHEIDEAGARHFAGIFEPPTVAEGLDILLVRRDGRQSQAASGRTP